VKRGSYRLEYHRGLY